MMIKFILQVFVFIGLKFKEAMPKKETRETIWRETLWPFFVIAMGLILYYTLWGVGWFAVHWFDYEASDTTYFIIGFAWAATLFICMIVIYWIGKVTFRMF